MGLIVMSDASDVGIGGALFQRHPDGKEYFIKGTSRALNTAERKLSVFRREILGLVHCCNAFKDSLICRQTPKIFKVDSRSIYLMAMSKNVTSFSTLMDQIKEIYTPCTIDF